MKNQLKIDPVGMNLKRGFYMLVWFTNPDKNPSPHPEEANSPIENGLGTQFYSTIEEAEEHIEFYSGNKIILQMIGQNPDGGFMSWRKVREYGDSFDLIQELTKMPEEYRIDFEKPPKEFPEGSLG